MRGYKVIKNISVYLAFLLFVCIFATCIEYSRDNPCDPAGDYGGCSNGWKAGESKNGECGCVCDTASYTGCGEGMRPSGDGGSGECGCVCDTASYTGCGEGMRPSGDGGSGECGCVCDAASYTGQDCIEGLKLGDGEPGECVCISECNDSIYDSDTGLFWQKQKSEDRKTWHSAINYCENLTLCGYSDWRLPSVENFKSILDNCGSDIGDNCDNCANSNKCSEMYPGDTSWYWTSDEYSSSHAWSVHFYYGLVTDYDKAYSSDVLCVRS